MRVGDLISFRLTGGTDEDWSEPAIVLKTFLSKNKEDYPHTQKGVIVWCGTDKYFISSDWFEILDISTT